MKALRQMGSGFIIGAISLLLVIGGISLSLAESSPPSLPPTPSPIPTKFAVEFSSSATSAISSPTQLLPPTNTAIVNAPPTATLVQATTCSIPNGWIAITVSANDTLYSIAERYKTTADNLNTSNCLNNLIPPAGSVIFVPPVPTVTVIPCGPPSSWIKAYAVKTGDNLYRVSLLYRTTVAKLQSANCMGSSTIIHVGQSLWVPNVPTSTPAFTATVPTSTNTVTNTPDYSTATATLIVTTSPTSTTAPTQTPSLTPLPSQTATTSE